MKNTIFTIALSILTLIVFIFGIVTITKINNMYNELSEQNNRLKSNISSISNDISSIEYRIREELEKQSSIIENYELKTGELDVEGLTVPVEILITPKEYKESTIISVTIGDTTINAERNDNVFTAKTNVSALEEHNVTISINTDGVIKNETIKDKINEKYKLTHKAKADMQGNVVYKDNKLTFENNDITIVYSPFKNSSVSKIRLFATNNGTEVWEKDITQDYNADTHNSFVFSKTFDVEQNKEFILYADIADSNGIKYRLFLKGVITQRNSYVNIEALNGNILYDKNGNEIVIR